MHIEVLRINFNHCKEFFVADYMGYKNALNRCVIACLTHMNKLRHPLAELQFEDASLQSLWESTNQHPHSEAVIMGLGLDQFRGYLMDMMEDLESFFQRKYPRRKPAVYLQLTVDATYHLCVQLRFF